MVIALLVKRTLLVATAFMSAACSFHGLVRAHAARDLSCAEDDVFIHDVRRGYAAFCAKSERAAVYHCGSYGCGNYAVSASAAAAKEWACASTQIVATLADRTRSFFRVEGCGRKGFYVCGLDEACFLVTGEVAHSPH